MLALTSATCPAHLLAPHSKNSQDASSSPSLTSLAESSSGDANLDHTYIKERLMGVKAILEEKIGESLDEMDEYLRDYKFSPETLMSLVDYYTPPWATSAQSKHWKRSLVTSTDSSTFTPGRAPSPPTTSSTSSKPSPPPLAPPTTQSTAPLRSCWPTYLTAQKKSSNSCGA